MGLTPDCRSYVGRTVLIAPFYGWGWDFGSQARYTSYDDVDRAGPFHAVITRFFEWEGELRGGIGTVQERGHALDGLRVAFSTRHVGEWNFTSQPGQYNVTVGAEELETAEGWLHAGGSGTMQGYASIRDDARPDA